MEQDFFPAGDPAAPPPEAIARGSGPIRLTKVNSLIETVAYGPIKSRRLGNSMGVNLLPPGLKICSFNCPYCECGWTNIGKSRREQSELPWPAPEHIEEQMRKALQRCVDQDFPIHHVTMAGNGEPSMHPRFGEAVEAIKRARDATFPDAKVVILTNAAHLDDPEKVRVLNSLDERMVKIDGGSDEIIKKINLPLFDFSIERVVDQVREKLIDNIVQSMFVRGRFANDTDEEVAKWIELVRRATPKRVQLYSLDRKAPDKTLERTPPERLQEIAQRLRDETGIEAHAFS
jgi:wyosine [tRNA(Phe)-imidazoG37] synthetase (radical SAM superfamily)